MKNLQVVTFFKRNTKIYFFCQESDDSYIFKRGVKINHNAKLFEKYFNCKVIKSYNSLIVYKMLGFVPSSIKQVQSHITQRFGNILVCDTEALSDLTGLVCIGFRSAVGVSEK